MALRAILAVVYCGHVIPSPAISSEVKHRLCWYSRRTADVLPELAFQTVEDGELLYCSHPMLFPMVGYQFDVRNCDGCDCFKARRARN
jgi:hypothetical protein